MMNKRAEKRLSDEEIEAVIKRMLEEDPTDSKEISDFISEHEADYSEDLTDYAFRCAVRCGAQTYVEQTIDEIELNDVDGYSSYLDETEDPEMQELLMDHGAFRSWDSYADCRFAMETVNGEFLAFPEAFRKEVLAKYLQLRCLSEEALLAFLTEGIEPEDLESEDDGNEEALEYTLENIVELLGIIAAPGGYAFVEEEHLDCDSYEVKDLLEALGWECDFEGDSWQLETTGVYFLR